MSRKQINPQEEKELASLAQLPEIDGVLIEEIEITEVIEIHLPEDEELEAEEFDSVFNTTKTKKLTPEEEEDIEDFNSYFFEE